MKMKNHSNYFQKVFIQDKNIMKNKEKERENIFKKTNQYYNHKYVLTQDDVKPHSPFLNKQDCLDNILAETFSMNSSDKIIRQNRKLSLNYSKGRVKIKRSNNNILQNQSIQQKIKEQSKEKRKNSCSLTRKKRKLDAQFITYLKRKIWKHSELFGLQKSNFLLHNEKDCHKLINLDKEVNTEKIVLWTQTTLTKIIQEFYSFLLTYSKNNKENIQSSLQVNNCSFKLNNLFKKFWLKKFKTQKLCRQNFINLMFSLFYHEQKLNKLLQNCLQFQRQKILSKAKYWQMFDKALNEQIQSEYIIFFLYSRYLFHTTFQEKAKINILNNRQKIRQFLKMLYSKDIYLVKNLQKKVFEHFQQASIVGRDQFLVFILNQSKIITHENKKSIVNQNRSSYLCQKPQKKKQLSKFKVQDSFWHKKSQNISINKELLLLLQVELDFQCQRLTQILFPVMQQSIKEHIKQIIKQKVQSMLNIISQMSKQKWFQQMKYQIISTKINDEIKDLQQIQSLQKMLKKIKTKCENKIICQIQLSQFIKKLLTPRIFLNKLQELVQLVNNFTTQ